MGYLLLDGRSSIAYGRSTTFSTLSYRDATPQAPARKGKSRKKIQRKIGPHDPETRSCTLYCTYVPNPPVTTSEASGPRAMIQRFPLHVVRTNVPVVRVLRYQYRYTWYRTHIPGQPEGARPPSKSNKRTEPTHPQHVTYVPVPRTISTEGSAAQSLLPCSHYAGSFSSKINFCRWFRTWCTFRIKLKAKWQEQMEPMAMMQVHVLVPIQSNRVWLKC